MRSKCVLLLLLLSATYLSLKNLGHTHFWDDEAQVGIMAKNFLATGRITGWDGRNLFAYRNGSALDENLRPRTPPLDYLVTAMSFKLFGTSTWAGRLPYVVAGLIALVIFLRLLREDWGEIGPLHIYALGALALSPVFLLNIRQNRYNALCLLCSLAVFYAYRRYFATKYVRFLVMLTTIAIVFFYAHFLISGAFLLALAIVHLAFDRRAFTKPYRIHMALAIVGFLLATVPYAVYHRVWYRPDMTVEQLWHLRLLKLTWWNLRELNLMGCMPWTIAGGLSYFFYRYWKMISIPQKAVEWAVLGVGNVLIIALISPQPTNVNTVADVRYLLASVPILAALVGVFFWFLHQKSAVVALLIFVVYVASNILTLTPFNTAFRWLLPGYIAEVHRAYPTAYGESVAFLLQNAKQDDLVYAYQEFTNYPLIFYLGDKFRFGCLLNHQTLLPLDTVKQLPAPLLMEENFPDWILAFGLHPGLRGRLQFFSRPHMNNGHLTQYQYVPTAILAVYFRDTHRPEIMWHSFEPKTDFDHRTEAVYIFRRQDVPTVGADT
jgi:4-amino-4-deoxy-L-arabinose transferase-like glycosyltransferase